jgi:hypothetical protein
MALNLKAKEETMYCKVGQQYYVIRKPKLLKDFDNQSQYWKTCDNQSVWGKICAHRIERSQQRTRNAITASNRAERHNMTGLHNSWKGRDFAD